MNPLFPCNDIHAVGRGMDSGKEWNYAARPGSQTPDLASKVKGWGLDLDFILDYITAESNSLAAVSMERSGNNWTWQCCKVGMQDATGELATFIELWKYDFIISYSHFQLIYNIKIVHFVIVLWNSAFKVSSKDRCKFISVSGDHSWGLALSATSFAYNFKN